MLKVAIGSDHGGFNYKEHLITYLNEKGIEVINVGTYSLDSCDYPEFGFKVAELVKQKEVNFGIVICTSGEGIAMAANKVEGVRCGIGYNDEVSMLMRKHNDANVIAFGAKFMTLDDVKRRIDLFLTTDFEGGRHERRVKMMK